MPKFIQKIDKLVTTNKFFYVATFSTVFLLVSYFHRNELFSRNRHKNVTENNSMNL